MNGDLHLIVAGLAADVLGVPKPEETTARKDTARLCSVFPVGTISRTARGHHRLLHGVSKSTTGDAPETVIVSATPPTCNSALTDGFERADELNPFAP